MHKIIIKEYFTATPGSRYIKDGPFSGEQFRDEFLEPLFTDKDDDSPIKIYLDGTEGYPSSFLDEAFGGLSLKYTKERVINRMTFISEENPILIKEIERYIERQLC